MLNPKEEAKFAELKDKCRELKVPAPPEIFIGLQVHENGVLVFDDKQRGHSWTRNLWNYMFSVIGQSSAPAGASFGAGYQTGKNTSGSIGATNGQPFSMSNAFAASAGVLTSGIVAGTGDTAFSVNQYDLVSPIAQGTGSGQLSYAASTTYVAGVYTAGTKTWAVTRSRIMNNNSGASITVKEVGVYGWAQMYTSGGSTILIERSVLSPTVAVANAAQLTVTYEISMDFSAID